MPPDNMAIDMRRTKLKAEEAALLAGELNKPSWESRNEGIHERVSFEDSIWGFDLAGGSYYKTPLRVVGIKPGSRAEKAGIRLGDKLKRINDIDTSTLTIQEAHEIIIESGIHLKIAVTAPEDEEDAYYCYEDPFDNGYDSEEERRKEEEKARKREVHAKVSSYWSLQWPWVSKRRIIYRESNCFMVPSKFEEKHKDRFSPQPMIRTQSDIVLDSIKGEMEAKLNKDQVPQTNEINGEVHLPKDTPVVNGDVGKSNNVVANDIATPKSNNLHEIPEIEEEFVEAAIDEEINSFKEDITEEISQNEEVMESEIEHSQNDISVDDSIVQSSEIVDNVENSEIADSKDETESEKLTNEEILQEESLAEESEQNDAMINEVLDVDDGVSNGEEEDIIDSILSDHEEINSHSDER